MTRCKHKHVELYQKVKAYSVWQFDGGNLVDEWPTEVFPAGGYLVKCRDCGYERQFSESGPKWALDLVEKTFKGSSA